MWRYDECRNAAWTIHPVLTSSIRNIWSDVEQNQTVNLQINLKSLKHIWTQQNSEFVVLTSVVPLFDHLSSFVCIDNELLTGNKNGKNCRWPWDNEAKNKDVSCQWHNLETSLLTLGHYQYRIGTEEDFQPNQ